MDGQDRHRLGVLQPVEKLLGLGGHLLALESDAQQVAGFQGASTAGNRLGECLVINGTGTQGDEAGSPGQVAEDRPGGIWL